MYTKKLKTIAELLGYGADGWHGYAGSHGCGDDVGDKQDLLKGCFSPCSLASVPKSNNVLCLLNL